MTVLAWDRIKTAIVHFDVNDRSVWTVNSGDTHSEFKVITFEIIEIVNDVLGLAEHNRELSLDALEKALGFGSVESKYPQLRNPKSGKVLESSLDLLPISCG